MPLAPPAAAAMPWLDRAAAPLDELRRACLVIVARLPGARACFARRELRISVVLLFQAALAFAGAIWIPMWLLLFGPLLLGIPHLAADARYLVLRRQFPRPLLGLVVVATAAWLVVPGLPFLRGDVRATRFCLGVFALALVGAVSVVLMTEARSSRLPAARLLRGGAVLAAFGSLLFWGTRHPQAFRLGLVHGHNLAAFVVVAVLAPKRRGVLLLVLPLVCVLGLAAMLATGHFSSTTLASPAVRLFQTHVLEMADGLAPGLSLRLAVGVTTCFAFLQSCHYLCWLVAIPSLDRKHEGSPTVRTRLKNYQQDLGKGGVLLALAALGALWMVATFGTVRSASYLYLTWAGFHAYVELLVFVVWLVVWLIRGRAR